MARTGSGGSIFQAEEEKQDRELTLGFGTLAILGFGLVALCGVCFIFGYAVGHRSPVAAVEQQQAVTPTPGLPASNQPKPAASEDPFAQTAPSAEATNPASPTTPPDAQASATPPANPQSVASTAGSSSAAAVVVPAALPATQASGQSAASGGVVHPALPQASGWVVQVAAVSQASDADVLLIALRRRGYNVAMRHDPADNLMHVQVGPFANHNDAVAMRQRLLNDGYNAVIQP